SIMGKRSLLAAVVVIVAMTATLIAACGDDDASKASTAGSGDSPAAIAAAITLLDQVGLHDIDTQLSSGKVPPTAQTAATHAQPVLLVTSWPAELRGQATTLAATLGTLAKGLDTDKPDLKAVAAAATRAHNDEHDFSHNTWAWLAKKAG